MAPQEDLLKQSVRMTLLMLVPTALFLAVISVIVVALRPSSGTPAVSAPTVQSRSLSEKEPLRPAPNKPNTGKLPAEI